MMVRFAKGRRLGIVYAMVDTNLYKERADLAVPPLDITDDIRPVTAREGDLLAPADNTDRA